MLFVTEIRSMAADNLWLSSAYGRDTVGIHFTWHPLQPEVEEFLPRLEAALLPLGARPHWGKLFMAQGESLRQQYPKFADFLALRQELDPEGKFLNGFAERFV